MYDAGGAGENRFGRVPKGIPTTLARKNQHLQEVCCGSLWACYNDIDKEHKTLAAKHLDNFIRVESGWKPRKHKEPIATGIHKFYYGGKRYVKLYF